MAGYFGSSSILVSQANQELIQQHKPTGWTISIKAYKFEFKCLNDCTVKINGSLPIFFEAGYEFVTDLNDVPIDSFTIVEAGISYKYIGAYK